MSPVTDADPPPLCSESRGEAPGRGRLEGRRVLVVGAGTQPSDDADAPIGNGRATAVLCAREGATIACADRDEASARETLASIEKEGGSGRVCVADVGEAHACEELVGEAQRALGGLDGLVLNVGIGLGSGLAGTTIEEWDRTLAVNLRSHFLLARTALPALEDGAAIVFVSSVAGRTPGSRLPAYDASKAGVEALCRHTALEGARNGVRANVVVPGLVDTPLGRSATRGRPSRARTPVPLGRQGTGWEIAYAVVFLLSNEAAYVTGQTLVVDGGLTWGR